MKDTREWSKAPKKNSDQWKKNEKLINSNPTLKRMRDHTEGFNTSAKNYGSSHGGKGSAQRPGNKQAYADNWERIFGGDRSNVNHREEDNE